MGRFHAPIVGGGGKSGEEEPHRTGGRRAPGKEKHPPGAKQASSPPNAPSAPACEVDASHVSTGGKVQSQSPAFEVDPSIFPYLPLPKKQKWPSWESVKGMRADSPRLGQEKKKASLPSKYGNKAACLKFLGVTHQVNPDS